MSPTRLQCWRPRTHTEHDVREVRNRTLEAEGETEPCWRAAGDDLRGVLPVWGRWTKMQWPGPTNGPSPEA